MNLFDWIFRPDKAKESQKALNDAYTMFRTLTAYQPVFTNWGGAIYESEIVRAAIDARARHISKLKVELIGTAQPSLQAKLKQGPNQWQTWSQFFYRASTILDINNNCFIVPVYDDRMVISGMFPVLPANCSLIEHNDELWLRYQFSSGQIGAVEFNKCAVLTKYQYQSDFFGDNNMALSDTMKLIHIQNQGIEEAVKNSNSFRFMAQLSNFAKPSDLALERSRFVKDNFATEVESGGFLLFPNTYKDIKQIDVKPYSVDADQMKAIRENVYNYFGVNEDVLQNKAYGDAWMAFYEGAIEPFAIQFSETMSKALFTERERAQGTQLMATANRLQYMSNNDKLNVTAQLLDRGLFSLNEAREIWNLPPVENGDQRVIRGEYYSADEKLTPTEDTNDGDQE